MTTTITTSKRNGLTSNEKGRHSELLAQTALLANGWQVSEPIAPEAYDLSFRKPDSRRTYYAQVKTAYLRNSDKDIKRYGREYIRVVGTKGNGEVYTRGEVDYFIAIFDGDVYMFPNREISEYWIKPADIPHKWSKLETGLKPIKFKGAD